MDNLKQAFKKITEQAQKDKVRVELMVTGGESLKLGYQKRQLEKFESTQSLMAGIRVVDHAVQGVSYTENLSDDSLLRTYRDALENAKTIGGGRADGEPIPLLKPEDLNQEGFVSDDLCFSEEVPMAEKKAVAEKFESLSLDADSRVQNVPYSGLSEVVTWRRVMNSEGIDRLFKQKYWVGHSYVLAKSGGSAKMSGHGVLARRFSEIDPQKVTTKAVGKALDLLGAEKLTTGQYPVVIDRECMTSFISMLEDYFSAKAVHEKKSLLAGLLGQKIAVDGFELIDDPLDRRGTGIRPFDSEGARSKATALISQGGVLQNYLTNLEYSQKMKLPHTAHAVRSPNSAMDIGTSNLKVTCGSATREEMLKAHPRVLLLARIAGSLHSGFKAATGDFSLPCEGFLYENGVRIKPVDQFVVSGNILQLLKDIEMIGNEWNEEGGSIFSPDILVKSLSVAGA